MTEDQQVKPTGLEVLERPVDSPAKKELKLKLAEWFKTHSNPYDRHICENVYWTMQDISAIINERVSEEVVNRCNKIYERFHFYL